MAKSKNIPAKPKGLPAQKNKTSGETRTRVSQNDLPLFPLNKALVIAQALVDQYASKSATPLQVAKAADMSPASSGFRYLVGSASAYGLTSGSYNSEKISLENLGKRIFKATIEGDSESAMREAFLKPRIIKDFFTKYNGSAIPREDIAKNVLEELGVAHDKLSFAYEMIITTGEKLGLISDHKGKKYIELNAASPKDNHHKSTTFSEDEDEQQDLSNVDIPEDIKNDPINLYSKNADNERLKKVFITHGKNTKFIDPIKKLLSFGELTPIVSVERTSLSIPVPEKVMNDMRMCGAAIIHVEDEIKLIDANAQEHVIVNQNVLIEIGAAMALYGKRFILLVKDGVKLPSNLQGLFEVRYEGDALDGNATIKLLEAINEIKNQQLP